MIGKPFGTRYRIMKLLGAGGMGVVYQVWDAALEEPVALQDHQTGDHRCIRGMRVTVGTVVGLVASGHSHDEILRAYPYLEAADISEALSYAAWRAEEVELPLSRP
jgi:uncharacterized protein (DUF433 family)